MGVETFGTVLDARGGKAVIAPALISEAVQRTVTEQAVEIGGILGLVAGEVLALTVLEKGIVSLRMLFH